MSWQTGRWKIHAKFPCPGTKGADQPRRAKPVKAERTTSCWRLFHGVGVEGWRNPEARQTFLLRNAVGAQVTVQAAGTMRESLAANVPLRG
jgi:hypothetical protein